MAEGLPPVDALRAVLDRVRSNDFLLLSGDVVSETSLRAQLLTHYVREAALTALLGRRKVPASQETKPGRPPKNVDYIGALAGCWADGLLCSAVFYMHAGSECVLV